MVEYVSGNNKSKRYTENFIVELLIKAPIHVQLNCTVNCANHNCTVNCANHNCTVMAPPIHAQLNCTVNCANRLVFTQSTAQLQPDTVE